MARRKITMEKIQEISSSIAQNFQPERIILFGSWAWGAPTPDSDVDFFIVKETNNTRLTAREIDGSIFPRPFPIDIIVSRPEEVEKRKKSGDFFINDVLTKGKLLYSS